MEGWVVCEDAYGHLSQRALYVTVYVGGGGKLPPQYKP